MSILLFTVLTLIAFQLVSTLCVTMHARTAVACGVDVAEISIGYTLGTRPLLRWRGRNWWWTLGYLPLGASAQMRSLVNPEDNPSNTIPKHCLEQAGTLARLLIMISGPLSQLLVGAVLLTSMQAIAAPRLAYPTSVEQQVRPSAIPGIGVDATAAATSSWPLVVDVSESLFKKMMLFQPLEGTGGLLGWMITGGAVATQSLSAWLAYLGLMSILNAGFNLLPLGGLTGAQIIRVGLEQLLPRLTVETWTMRYTMVSLIYILMVVSWSVYADLLWLIG